MESEAQKKLSDIFTGIDHLKVYRDLLKSRILSSEKEINDHNYKMDIYVKCSELFKKWLEDSIKHNIDSISELVSSGLGHIIFDQQLSFKIQQEMKYNRVSMKFTIDDNGVEGNPMDSFGGGPAVVASLILRLSVMARLGMGNLLLLDESMSSLANHYVPNAAEFMKSLSEQTGINILMVTHNNEFLQRCHVAYEGFKEDGCFRLRKVSDYQ